MKFNLLVEPWIPVLYADGQVKRLGIREALTKASAIRQVAASNLMDNVAPIAGSQRGGVAHV